MHGRRPCKNCGGTSRDKHGKCVPCERTRKKRWQKENKEKHRAADARWKAENRDRHRESARRQYERDPDRKKAQAAKWRKDNPEKARAKAHRRRMRKEKAGGSFTAAEWQALCDKYDNRCCYPGCENTDLTIDHIVPISMGGNNDISNIQPLCLSHNSRKGATVADYRKRGGVRQWIQKKLFG